MTPISSQPAEIFLAVVPRFFGRSRCKLFRTRIKQNFSDLPSLIVGSAMASDCSRVRRLYDKAGVFETAMQLVDKHQARAEQVADEIDVDPLRRLFYFLVDTVLERPELPSPAVVSLGVNVALG